MSVRYDALDREYSKLTGMIFDLVRARRLVDETFSYPPGEHTASKVLDKEIVRVEARLRRFKDKNGYTT